MKQILNENILSNHTVAKITCECNFNLEKIVKQKIKTITKTNTIIEIVYDDNGNLQYIDDLDENGNEQLIYEYKTRFLTPTGTIIAKEEYDQKVLKNDLVYIACFVGCTYHCG